MSFEVVTQPERWVAGLVTRTRNSDELDPERARLPRLWERAARGGDLIAVLTDYESDRTGEYTQVVGRVIDDPRQLEGPLVAVRVPAGEYARVVAEGEVPQAIFDAWRRIWTAEANGDLRRGYRTDFEVWREGSAPEIYLSLAS